MSRGEKPWPKWWPFRSRKEEKKAMVNAESVKAAAGRALDALKALAEKNSALSARVSELEAQVAAAPQPAPVDESAIQAELDATAQALNDAATAVLG